MAVFERKLCSGFTDDSLLFPCIYFIPSRPTIPIDHPWLTVELDTFQHLLVHPDSVSGSHVRLPLSFYKPSFTYLPTLEFVPMFVDLGHWRQSSIVDETIFT